MCLGKNRQNTKARTDQEDIYTHMFLLDLILIIRPLKLRQMQKNIV